MQSKETSKALSIHSLRYSKEVAVKLLEKNIAWMNAQAPDGNTPVHFACMNGDIPLITALLAAGADPGVENDAGGCSINWAAEGGSPDVLKTLHVLNS